MNLGRDREKILNRWTWLKSARIGTAFLGAVMALLGFALLFKLTIRADTLPAWEATAAELSVAVAIALFALRSVVADMLAELEEEVQAETGLTLRGFKEATEGLDEDTGEGRTDE